jgi:hypothetical protein
MRKLDHCYNAEENRLFAEWLTILNAVGAAYVIGGAFAVYAYTGNWRNTKDLDVFIKPDDVKKALDALSKAGHETELRDVNWLAKVCKDPYLMDLIFGVGNNRFKVDDGWIERSEPVEILGVETRLISIEELIASKVYIVKRDRFDGADIVQLIRAEKGEIDWERLLGLLGSDRDLILWHLLLFNYVYPGHPEYLPQDLMIELFEDIRGRWSKPEEANGFRGMLLDPISYAVSCEKWGYEDPRNVEPLVDANGARI